jgi:hypothetical protein
MKNLLYILLFSFASCIIVKPEADDEIFYESKSENNQVYGINEKPSDGKGCYAKCMIIKADIENETMILPVYTGNGVQTANIEVLKIVTKVAGTNWVKKRADRNCLSNNPDDCLVWCLQEVPAETKEIQCVKDTSLTKEFKFKTYNVQKRIPQSGSGVEWREVLCENNITNEIIQQLCNQLNTRGYQIENTKDSKNPKLRAAIVQYQKEKGLPVGELNLETLRSLGVKY